MTTRQRKRDAAKSKSGKLDSSSGSAQNVGQSSQTTISSSLESLSYDDVPVNGTAKRKKSSKSLVREPTGLLCIYKKISEKLVGYLCYLGLSMKRVEKYKLQFNKCRYLKEVLQVWKACVEI